MNEKKPSLPSDIDTEVLKITSDLTTTLKSVAEGWKLLTTTIQEQAEKIKELTPEDADAKESN